MNTEQTPATEAVEIQTPAPAEPSPVTVAPEVEPVIEVAETEKKSVLQIAVAVVIGLLILGSAGYFVYTNYYEKGGVVAVVNGKNIYRTELDESMALIRQNPTVYGIDPASPTAETAVQTQAIDVLITNALLITAAEQGGFTVNDEDVETTYSELIAQLGGEDELQSQIAAVGLTEEKLRSNIRERELVDRYLAENTDFESVTVDQAEIENFVKTLESNNIELPPLEEIRPQLEAELKSQKQQQIVSDLLVKLRGEANIEMRI